MAKRFTCTDKWKKAWFSELSKEGKLLWIYITDNCNHAGICDYSEKIFSVMLDFKVTQEKITELLGDKIQWLEDNKFFIPSFIEFQYGELNPQNRAHKSVIDQISKIKEGAYKGLTRPLQGCKDKYKDKVINIASTIPPEIELVKAYIKEKSYTSFTAENWFNFYAAKGWMIGKSKMKDWKASVRTWGEKEKQESEPQQQSFYSLDQGINQVIRKG